MVPSAPTDFTMPMCSPQTIRSPGLGRPEPPGTARCACCAQAHTASTEPKPWPWSPSGLPAWRATHDTKYAHHGPTPGLPAVALRYWAILGELLDPGGDSAWPPSAWAIWTMEPPPPPAGGATLAVAAAGCAP